MDEHELMGKMKISKAVAKMAIPSVISSLVTVVYNMADTFFVGQTGDPLQVAAVSLTNPIFILMMAFANMFGMGGSTVLSMALGAKDEKRAKNASAFVTYASLIIGIAFTVILIVFMNPILALFGANAETYEFARGYTFHISYGAPFIIWSAAASFIVRAEGSSREAMIGSMIGTIVNIGSNFHFCAESGDGRSCDCDYDRKCPGQSLLSVVFPAEESFSLCRMEVFYCQRWNFNENMCVRTADRNLFRSDECVHDHPQSASGCVWKRPCSCHWDCI